MSSFAEWSESLASLVEQGAPSIVRIEGGRRFSGSGVAWSTDTIVTAHHVLEQDERVEIGLHDGTSAQAAVVGRDPATDLAVLKLEGGALTPARWDDGAALKVGHFVLALARPGRTVRAAGGIVSAIGPSWRTYGGGKLDRYVHLDINRYPGFSGGAIVDAGGRVIGVSTAGLMRGVTLAIPTSTLRRVVESVTAHGHVQRGFLGVGVYPVRLPDAARTQLGQESGALIISVQPGSAAEKAGIFLGDVLVSVDGQPITEPADLIAFLDEEKVGKAFGAKVLRAGAVSDVTLTVGTRGER